MGVCVHLHIVIVIVIVGMEDTVETGASDLEIEEDSSSICSGSMISSPDDRTENVNKQYRLASSFELGDEQPQGDSANLRKREDNSFKNLFGPPEVVKTEKQTNEELQDQKIMSKKQL